MTTTNAAPNTAIHNKGDLAALVGSARIVYGGVFYEYRMIDGHLAGEVVVIPERIACDITNAATSYLPEKGQR